MGSRRILALTILQPWAELIVHGPKRVENRSWAPHELRVGDYLALHAGKSVDADAWGSATETAREADLLGSLAVIDGLLALPPAQRGDRFALTRQRAYVERACAYSAVVGVARLEAVERERPEAPDPWWFGPVGWRLGDVVAFEPVPCRGARGLWELPPDVLAAVRERWGAKKVSRG